MDYNKRQNPLTKATTEDFKEIFIILEATFDKKWLEEDGDNPIRKLWKRSDYAATNELYTLGFSIKELNKIDANWVKGKVKNIKQDGSLGAIFEIIAMYAIKGQNDIQLFGDKKAGIDGLLKLKENKKIRISLKRYGTSVHNKSFNLKSEQLENLIKKIISEINLITVQVIVTFLHEFPLDNDWTDIIEYMPSILRRFKESRENSFAGSPNGRWIVQLGVLVNTPKETYCEELHSYTLIVVCEYHKNEIKNIYDKLEEACVNITSHEGVEDDDTMNFVFVHLPQNTSFNLPAKWVSEYLSQTKKPVSGVILYQAAIVNGKQTSHIEHCFGILCKNPILGKWTQTIDNPFLFNIVVGIVTNQSSSFFMKNSLNDETFSLDEKYIYQRGNHYIMAQSDAKGGLISHVSALSPGIFVHSVTDIFQDGNLHVISGIFPPSADLLIL